LAIDIKAVEFNAGLSEQQLDNFAIPLVTGCVQRHREALSVSHVIVLTVWIATSARLWIAAALHFLSLPEEAPLYEVVGT
jgi:hypothetical protein